MRVLTFRRNAAEAKGSVRGATFEERSLLPVAAACVVANAVREVLAALFGDTVTLSLLAPVVPSTRAWSAIGARARLYRVRGSAGEAVVVVRAIDALALARAAFGEPHFDAFGSAATEFAPSPLEEQAIDRIVAAVGASLASICGVRDRATPERLETLGVLQTYFELQIARPVEARIGIALARDPTPAATGSLGLNDVAAVPLDLHARLEVGAFTAARVAALAPGDVLPIAPTAGLHGSLALGDRTVAAGRCGVRNGWYALAVESVFAGGDPAHEEARTA